MTYEQKWTRERHRQSRCAELQKQHAKNAARCARRKRKACEVLREVEREAVELYCGWVNPSRIPRRRLPR